MCDVAYVMQREQIRRQWAPIATGMTTAALVAPANPELFRRAMELVDTALADFDEALTGDGSSSVLTHLQQLQREAGIA